MLLIGPSFEINKKHYATRWVSNLRMQPLGRVSFALKQLLTNKREFCQNRVAMLTICFQEIGLAVLFRCRSPYLFNFLAALTVKCSTIRVDADNRRYSAMCGGGWSSVACRSVQIFGNRKQTASTLDSLFYLIFESVVNCYNIFNY